MFSENNVFSKMESYEPVVPKIPIVPVLVDLPKPSRWSNVKSSIKSFKPKLVKSTNSIMSAMRSLSPRITSKVNLVNTTFNNNKTIFTIISILIVLYTVMIAPKLPKSSALILNNNYVKFAWLFVIILISSQNPLIAILLSLAVLITIQTMVALESKVTNKCMNNKCVNEVQSSTPATIYDNDNIPLSPKRAQLIQDSMLSLNNYNNAAQVASKNGDTNSTQFNINEANKQNIKINCLLKSKAALLIAQKAESDGDLKTAAAQMNEVRKNNIKIMALLNSEDYKNKAYVERENGNNTVANEHFNNAQKEDDKVDIMLRVDTIIENANIQIKNGNNKQAKLLIHEAIKLYEQLNINETENRYPVENDLSYMYSLVTDQMDMNPDMNPVNNSHMKPDTNVHMKPVNNSHTMSDSNDSVPNNTVHSYSGHDYATC